MDDEIQAPRKYAGAIVVTWKQLAAISAFVLSVVGVAIGCIQYIDSEFDDLRVDMLQAFKRIEEQNATAADDLNYRLGIHRGAAIGKALGTIEIEKGERHERVQGK